MFYSKNNDDIVFNYSVIDILKNINNDSIKKIKEYMNTIIKKYNLQKTKIQINQYHNNEKLNIVENTSAINANAIITKIFKDEFGINLDFINREYLETIFENEPEYKNEYYKIKKQIDTNNEFENILFHVNFVMSYLDKRIYLLRQIDNYKWLDNFYDYEIVKKNLINQIDYKSHTLVEQEIIFDINSNNLEIKNKCENWLNNNFSNYKFKKFCISGRVDLINDETLFELKCVDELTNEHILQIIIYIWINNILNKFKVKKYILFNIKNNEKIEIFNEQKKINDIVKLLINSKLKLKEKQISDKDFLNQVD